MNKSESQSFPIVYSDKDSDFASIKLKPGVEAKSYIKDGVVVCEDENGEIIEVQILNVSSFKQGKSA